MIERPLVYLAGPYSHDDRAVRIARFDAINRAASKLMRDGLKIFSPISHTHPIAEAGGLPCGWEYWSEYDHAVLSVSHKMIVLMLDGWQESVGVTAELSIAREMNISIEYLEPEPIEKGSAKRIQRKRTSGFRLPPKTLCVSRPSMWGNPYSLAEFGEMALPLFKNTVLGVWNPALLDGQPESLRSRAYGLHHAWQRRFQYHHPLDVLRSELRKYDFIACWCKEPKPGEPDLCHAAILLDLANQ